MRVSKTMIFRLAFFLMTIYGYTTINAQIALIKDGRSHSRIVISEDGYINRTAGNILQTFIQRISQCPLPVVLNQSPRIGDIVIGGQPTTEVTEDGFRLFTQNGIFYISGKENGTIYGVVTLLERYLGVDYWGDHEYSFVPQKSITLPLINVVENPAFAYRQSQCYAIEADSVYKWWHRLEEPEEVFADKYWVHTFDRLLPASVYGNKHPEYYSYFNGRRQPGNASQWCLTNPDILEIVAQRIDSIFKANPERSLISVSQNDGNFTNCTCDNCRKIDEKEGSPSGSLIYFINKLAARFPDKEFATLAYLYTMKPPKYVKPLSNVIIMLCDIDCKREVSLTENESGREFMEAMEGWAGITDRLFVWDYGINFDNYLTPFPNFHILKDNICLFRKNKVTMHFSQIAGSWGGDFAELRAYLVSKLMWNPEADVDSLMRHFLNGYYGEAASPIYRYIKTMEGALIASGQPLWIFDSPVPHKSGMLKPELMRRYHALFDEAEKKVAGDVTLLERVQRARLPLQYSELEIARTMQDKDLEELNQKLLLFEERIKKLKVRALNERMNSPVEYCQLYRERYMRQADKNQALGAKVSFLIPPTGKYEKMGTTALTDGLFGGSTFVESWIGWEGVDGAFIVDLGKIKEIHSVETDFLYQQGQWVLMPLEVIYSYSEDGRQYTSWETHKLPEEKSVEVKYYGIKTESANSIRTRYVKVEITGSKVCPQWHCGVGRPSWFFIDEVVIE